VIGYIKALKPDIVVLSGVWDFYLHYDPSGGKLLHTIELVKAAGVQRVVIIGSAPTWKGGVPALLVSQVRRNLDHSAPDRLPRTLLAAHDDNVIMATAQKTGAVYVPLFEDLCDQTSCIVATGPSWRDVLTSDNAHFTEHGSVVVAQRIWPGIIHSGT
jgi:hypothetical protein